MAVFTGKFRIIIPLDVSDPRAGVRLASTLEGYVGGFKIGRQAIDGGFGHGLANAVGKSQVFWDSKMSDIPNTTVEATKNAKEGIPEGLWAINIHANSGHDSIRKMVEERGKSKVWAVTLLTSITEQQCEEIYHAPPGVVVLRLAGIALRQGVQGIICSPQEIKLLRKEYGKDFEIVTPGVRSAGVDTHDQARVDTPENAILNGADYLVCGRQITGAEDPVVAARKVAHEINQALKKRRAS